MMGLQIFRQIVDGAPPGITACEGDLQRLYDYVGLEHGTAYTCNAVSETLYAQIRDCFTSGHAEVWRACRSMRTDLIREHVLRGAPLDPYFEVLDCLQDAIRTAGDLRAPVEGDWGRAIQSAFDHVQFQSRGASNRESLYARDFMVARAARLLRDAGFSIRLEPGRLSLEETAETELVVAIEDLVATMGGINVARRIFKAISPLYDLEQQRYHLIQRPSMTAGGLPQVPWGYLIQLAVKHAPGRKPYDNTAPKWHKLLILSQAFAAVIDVQPYTPSFYGRIDAISLVPYLQEMAVYDTLFRIPQMRPTDVVKLAHGMFDWLDMSAPTKAGWSISQALEIVAYLLDPVRDGRGPVFIDEADVRCACPKVPREIVTKVLDGVLSHSPAGSNQNFSRPMDAPILGHPDLRNVGHDFFLRPLLHHSGRRFILLDRSICAPACLEALLTPLRSETKEFDKEVGLAVERFLKAEFALHGIPVVTGDYDAGGEHGECDLIVEAPETVIFFELKKKALTRQSKAGSDAHLLMDLAASLLAAQAQAGWHEVRLRRHGHLTLKHDGGITRLELNGRGVERVAVSLSDFGGFQDRTLLMQFLEAAIVATFTPIDTKLNKKFAELNEALAEVHKQVVTLYPNQDEIRQPFFNCWFLSMPLLLTLLDGVTDAAGFKIALWSCRHMVTGSSDIYFDLSYRRRLQRSIKPATG